MSTTPDGREIRLVGSQQPFTEVPTLHGEAIRVTWIPTNPTAPGWAGEPRVRISKVQANHQVFPGPEVPLSRVPDFVRALTRLLLEIAPSVTPPRVDDRTRAVDKGYGWEDPTGTSGGVADGEAASEASSVARTALARNCANGPMSL